MYASCIHPSLETACRVLLASICRCLARLGALLRVWQQVAVTLQGPDQLDSFSARVARKGHQVQRIEASLWELPPKRRRQSPSTTAARPCPEAFLDALQGLLAALAGSGLTHLALEVHGLCRQFVLSG